MGANDIQELVSRAQEVLGFEADFTQVLLAFALLMTRLLPVIIFTPFLGGETVPQEVKIGLGIMLGLVLFPVIVEQVRAVPVSVFFFIALMLKELFLGLTIAFVVGMVFEAAQAAGSLLDTLSGTNQAQLMVPQIAHNASLYSALQIQMTTVLFLTLGGHHIVIETFGDSLVQIPLNQFPQMSHGAWGFYETILRVFADLTRVAFALASPALVATFLVDFALGMINRVAPQVQVFFVSMQIKPVVTVIIMVSAVHLILDRVVGEYGVMFRLLRRVLELLT